MLKLILFCFVLFPLLASEQIVYEKYLNYTALQLSKNEVPENMRSSFEEYPHKKAIVNYEAEQTLLHRVVFYHGAPVSTALRQLLFTIAYEEIFGHSLPEYPLYNYLHPLDYDCNKNGGFLYVTPGLFTNGILRSSEGNFRCPWAYVSGIIHKNIEETMINAIIESFFEKLSLGTLALIKENLEDNNTLSMKIKALLEFMKDVYSKILSCEKYHILYAISMPLDIAQKHVFIAQGKGDKLEEHPSGYKSWFDLINNYESIIKSKHPYIEVGIPNNIFTCPQKAAEYGIEVKQFGGNIPKEDQEELKKLVKILMEEIKKESLLKCYSKEKFSQRYF